MIMMKKIKEKILKTPIIWLFLTVLILGITVGGIYIFKMKKDKQAVQDSQETKTDGQNQVSQPVNPQTETKDITANWRVYKDIDLGIEFKYPPEWGEITTQITQGQTGYVFSNNYNKQSFYVSMYTKDWLKPIGMPSTFSYYSKNSNGTYDYHISNNEKVVTTFQPIKSLISASGDEALIIGGNEATRLGNELRGPGESELSSHRLGFINIAIPYKNTVFKGIRFQYLNIPSSEVESFDQLIASFKRI